MHMQKPLLLLMHMQKPLLLVKNQVAKTADRASVDYKNV